MLIFFSLLFFPLLHAFSSFIPKYCPQICLGWCKNHLPLFYICEVTLSHCPVVPTIIWCSSTRAPGSASAANVVSPISVDFTSQRTEALCTSASKNFHCGIPTVGVVEGMWWVNTLGSLFCLAPKILEVLFLWIDCTHVLSFSLLRCKQRTCQGCLYSGWT